MQTKNSILRFALLLLALCLLGCEKYIESGSTNSGEGFSIWASDGGYNSPDSKAYESYYSTVFESGDVMGVYVVKNGAIIAENHPITQNALGEWMGTLSYSGGANYDSNQEPTDGVIYFAYFPYQQEIDSSLLDLTATNADDFFANMTSSWTIHSDQSDYGYENSDLMIAKGYFESLILNTYSLFFEFTHQMSMLHFEFPAESLTSQSVTMQGSEIFPYLSQLTQGPYANTTNHYRYIMNPYSQSELSVNISYTDSLSEPFSSENTIDITPSSYVYFVVDASALPSGTAQIADSEGTIGAFWRYNESGERIISIQPAVDDYGSWHAIVYQMDSEWDDRSDIRLSSNVSELDLSQDAELFQINDLNQIVRGYCYSTSSPIEFRVALTQTNFDMTRNDSSISDTYVAARYATILLVYANYTKYQFIYLRQGEDPDYLFRAGHTYNSARRDAARKFSPYNLAPNTWSTTNYVTLTSDNASMTAYPSQVGAMYRWHNLNAWMPQTVSGYTTSTNTLYWDDLRQTLDVMPSTNSSARTDITLDYRRAIDGLTDSAVTEIDYSVSEHKQSLFAEPDATNASNCIYGGYSDGYYDRGGDSSGVNVASKGLLFYNESNFASLFFPIYGSLSTAGVLTSGNSSYFSGTASSTDLAWGLTLNSSSEASLAGCGVNTGQMIRLIVNE